MNTPILHIPKEAMMLSKSDVTEMIYEKKRQAGLSWASIAEGIGMSEVFVTSACLGMNALPRVKADLLVRDLGLPQECAVVLAEFPTKVWGRDIPTDPCIYRLYEIVGVYGETLKELIQEKCGNGIMSAIDFDMVVEKVANPKGDRIEIRMSGKYLGYNSW
ncbi:MULTISPECIES: cyanase [unclassified Rhizobium]|uniref:cyanase n=3 Tax=Rhizobiaceae TaxID=82115 RepID=UPI001FCDE307|nr:cyanase [Rhizobium sp. Leaf321]